MLPRRLALLALLALLAGLPLLASPDDPQGVPPVQRLYVGADKLPAELAKLPGELVKLPRAEFEKRLRAAEEHALRGRHNARVLEARYQAVLRDEDLLGSARWEVLCPENGPAAMPLLGPGGAFSLALRRAPRIGDRELLLAEVDARGPLLILDEAGTHTVEFTWSSRLERTPDGLTFELRGPACPAGVLELYLPGGWGLSGAPDVLLTGPLPLPPAEERGADPVPDGYVLWRVHGIGRGAVRLALSPAGETGPPLAFVRRWHSSHRIAPDGVETTLEAALELLPRGGNEVAFEWDASLKPYAVEVAPSVPGGPVPELLRWKLDPGTGERPSVLSVRLRQPVNEVVVTIQALGPLSGSAGPGGAVRWSVPGLRAVRAVPRGETIDLLLHPDLRLDGWQAGDFRLTGTGTVPDPGRGVNFARLTLTGGGVRPEDQPGPRRPSLLVHPSAVEFRARPITWWEIDSRRSSLTVHVPCEVQQGRLFGLPIQLPAGWEVEQVDVEPLTLGARWRTRRDRGKTLVQVELQTPLTASSPTLTGEIGSGPRAQARIKMRLRSASPGVPWNKTLPFPEVVVPGARFREGALALDVDDELLLGRITGATSGTVTDEDGPWGRQLPDFYHAYRNGPLQGSVTITARPPRILCRVRTEVILAAARAGLRLEVEAEAGSTDTLELLLPTSRAADWEWRVERGTNHIRRIERLPGSDVLAALSSAGAPSALSAALYLAVPTQTRYRLTLSRSLRLHEVLVLSATIRLEPHEGRWEVPLPSVPQASRLDGEVDLHLTATDPVRVDTEGLRESAAAAPRARTAWRTYRYSNGPARLTLHGRDASPGRLAEVHARLNAWPTEDGRLHVHFQFHLAGWREATLPTRLPVGAELVAVRADGHAVSLEPETKAEGPLLMLPVPSRGGDSSGWHRFEILYTLPAPSFGLWQTLEAQPPALLPLEEPLTFLRTWRLPPGLTPALTSEAARLPGPGEGIDPAQRRVQPADLFHLVPWPRRWLEGDPGATEPLSTLPLALALRAIRPDADLTLRELFDQLAMTAARERQGLVVDAAAWTEQRLRLDARIRLTSAASEAPPAWEQAGLALVPVPGGYLVTTLRQREAWTAPRPTLPPAVGEAVEQALSDGHDRSGRFRALSAWLPSAARDDALGEGRGGAAYLLPPDLELPGWSAWSPLAGSAEGRLFVVRQGAVVAAGIVLALLGGLGMLALRSGRRWRRRFWLIVWVALAGLALLWLPTALQPLAWYPLVLGGVLVLLAYLRRLRKAAVGNPPSVGTTSGVAILLLVGVAAFESHARQAEEAQTPARATVLVLGKPEDPVERQFVLAPPTLLEQLDRLGEPLPVGLREGAVLTGAQCHGKLVEGAAEFDATFTAHSFADLANLVIPLEGVHLLPNSLWLDDARVFPTTLPAPREGYQIPLRGAGKHKLEMRFRVAVQAPIPGEQLVQFTLPKLLGTRLSFTVPGKEAVLVPGRVGAHETRIDGNTATLNADLGRLTGPVQLRWTTGVLPGVQVQFQEAYLWDLRADASTLTALLRYSVSRGNVRELVLDIPDDLLVRAVTATRPGGGEARVQGYRLRDGRPTGELTIRFQAPLTGDILVALDLVPRGPLPANIELALPSPRGEATGGYLAYRIEGLEARPTGLLRITGIQPTSFAPFWPVSSRPDPARLAFASTISRQGGAGPELRLALTQRPVPVQVEQDLTLRIGATQAELLAKLDLSSPGADLSLVEWEVIAPQPVILSSVRGAGLRRWSQQGNRLLVWLERTTATKLEVQGWQTLVTEPKKPSLLNLPQLRLVSPGKQTGQVRLLAQPGAVLVPQPLPGLRAIGEPSPVEALYQMTAPGYSGSVLVEVGGLVATARLLTFVEVIDRNLHFQTLIACRIPQGELRSLTVSLNHWEGTADLTADRVVARRERGRPGGSRTWVLDLQPGTTKEYTLTVSGSLAPGDLSGPPGFPEVTLGGVRTTETWAVVGGQELSAEAATGVQAQPGLPADSPPLWGKKLERARKANASVWKVTSTPWQVRLKVAPLSGDHVRPAVVLLEERHLRRGDGARWLHESSVWLRFDRQTDLTLQLPRAARVASVSLAGVELPPLQPAADQLWVPLPGQPGVALLRVRWEYEPGVETFEQPLLDAPRLDNTVREGPTLWTLDVPQGWETGTNSGVREGPSPRIVQHLTRAEAAMNAARHLSELAKEQSTATGLEPTTQRRFYQQLRQAEWLIERFPDVSRTVGPDGISAAEWLTRLSEQNVEQARRLGYEEARAEAEKLSRIGLFGTPQTPPPMLPLLEERLAARGRLSNEAPPLPVAGRPVLGRSGADEAFAPGKLRPTHDHAARQATTASLVWLGLVLAVVVLSQIEFLVSRLRRLIPEQLLLVAASGYALAGWTPLVIGLLALGVLGRFLVTLRWIWPKKPRRSTATDRG